MFGIDLIFRQRRVPSTKDRAVREAWRSLFGELTQRTGVLDLGTSFVASVERDPGAVAIVDGSKRLSYREWYGKIPPSSARSTTSG